MKASHYMNGLSGRHVNKAWRVQRSFVLWKDLVRTVVIIHPRSSAYHRYEVSCTSSGPSRRCPKPGLFGPHLGLGLCDGALVPVEDGERDGEPNPTAHAEAVLLGMSGAFGCGADVLAWAVIRKSSAAIAANAAP